jgi:hypothetical protein
MGWKATHKDYHESDCSGPANEEKLLSYSRPRTVSQLSNTRIAPTITAQNKSVGSFEFVCSLATEFIVAKLNMSRGRYRRAKLHVTCCSCVTRSCKAWPCRVEHHIPRHYDNTGMGKSIRCFNALSRYRITSQRLKFV